MLDFTAIDFETANSFQGSPCAVGVVKIRDGRVVAQHHVFVRPPEAASHFSAFNTSIHGITADDVRDAPTWRQVLAWLIEFVGDDIVVAHNAGFDIGVIRYACMADGIEWPELHFLCSLVISRRALSLPSYTLPFVVESVGFRLEDHHNAPGRCGHCRAYRHRAGAPSRGGHARGPCSGSPHPGWRDGSRRIPRFCLHQSIRSRPPGRCRR
ncbi:exonuclease domain-containing protein [Janibacter limosus]|uniref:DNA polymerase III subunit epsilon n=1 Tax=Janibacter limosus TaxID=53458 RepID=A0AC61U4V0_9MICO|nr:exonuclease domain-containing protein [Janibacter limosus]UUZ45014.1 exonuclease domain-containing protein [Janibacter limosus]